jgi:hypothetical protein
MKPTKEERIRYNVDYAQDSAFQAHARLLQSQWREANSYPPGKLGNYIETKFAKEHKVNFLTDRIKDLALREIYKGKQIGALISEPRIWDNMLSSQPLCFNLFGELQHDLELATSVFQFLFPGKIDKVVEILFEHSPGRGDSRYLEDNTAFDCFIEYYTNGNRGFIGIETKYHENMKGIDRYLFENPDDSPSERIRKSKYLLPVSRSGIFNPETIDGLFEPTVGQILRDHLLSVVTKPDYDEGFFVFLYPSQNYHCKEAVEKYIEHLISVDESVNGFYPRHLEDFVSAIKKFTNEKWILDFEGRYFGFGQV